MEKIEKTKRVFFSEIAYILGILFMTLGIALTAKANYGMSMVVAPAYAIYAKVSQYWSWFSLGMSQYLFQLVLILILCLILRSFKIKFFLSFVTAFIDGLVLDFFIWALSFIPDFDIVGRIIFFIIGMVSTSLGVAFFFNTYLPAEAYELFVKKISEMLKKDTHKVKLVYDISSLILAVILSFSLFGFLKFEGVGIGTLICAILNGFIIGFFNKTLNKLFTFKDGFKIRKFFNC